MKIDWLHDSINLEATHEELEALKNLLDFCDHNGVSLDRLYEMISSLLRPKLVIKVGNPSPEN